MAFAVQIDDPIKGRIIVKPSIDDDSERTYAFLHALAYQSLHTGWHLRPDPAGNGFYAAREPGGPERRYKMMGFNRQTFTTYPFPHDPSTVRSTTVEVDDGLWIGGDMADIPDGIRLVITLEESSEPITAVSEIRYPFRDSRWERAPRDVIQAAVDDAIGSYGPVLIRCRYGLNRSGLVAAIILRHRGYEPDDAVSLVQMKRLGALTNTYFRALVRTWPDTSMDRRDDEERYAVFAQRHADGETEPHTVRSTIGDFDFALDGLKDILLDGLHSGWSLRPDPEGIGFFAGGGAFELETHYTLQKVTDEAGNSTASG